MNWKRIRKWVLIGFALGTLTVLIGAWVVGGALVVSANRTVGPSPDNFPSESIQIESKSGSLLAGWYSELKDSKATVVLLHPIRSDRRSMLSRARLFRRHGYSTLLVDLQAHGESNGKNITLGYLEKYDVLAAVEFVREINPGKKVVIVGWSLGGASALLATPDVNAIVLESVFPSVSEAVHNRLEMRLGTLHNAVAPLLLLQMRPRLGITPDQLRPIDKLAQIQCPVVVASGDRDQHTTIEETRRMFEAARNTKQLVVFEGAAHVDLLAYDASKYESDIVSFVDQVIADE